MKTSIKNGILTIEIPVTSPPTLTTSGKSLMVASTRGNLKTEVMVDSKPLTVSVNAYIAK